MGDNGCEYGRANRAFIEEIRESLHRIEGKIDNELKHRWPQSVAIIVTVLSSLVVALLVFILGG